MQVKLIKLHITRSAPSSSYHNGIKCKHASVFWLIITTLANISLHSKDRTLYGLLKPSNEYLSILKLMESLSSCSTVCWAHLTFSCQLYISGYNGLPTGTHCNITWTSHLNMIKNLPDEQYDQAQLWDKWDINISVNYYWFAYVYQRDHVDWLRGRERPCNNAHNYNVSLILFFLTPNFLVFYSINVWINCDYTRHTDIQLYFFIILLQRII